MTKQVDAALLSRYHTGDCSPEEVRCVEQWLTAAEDVSALPEVPDEALYLNRAWDAVAAGMHTAPVRRLAMRQWAAVAASIILMAGMVYWLLQPGKEAAVEVAGGMTKELAELKLALPAYADAVVNSRNRSVRFSGDLQVTNTSGSDQLYTFTYAAEGKPAVVREVLLRKGKKYIIGYSEFKRSSILVFTANRFNTLPPGINI